jgi:hypothetical protein
MSRSGLRPAARTISRSRASKRRSVSRVPPKRTVALSFPVPTVRPKARPARERRALDRRLDGIARAAGCAGEAEGRRGGEEGRGHAAVPGCSDHDRALGARVRHRVVERGGGPGTAPGSAAEAGTAPVPATARTSKARASVRSSARLSAVTRAVALHQLVLQAVHFGFARRVIRGQPFVLPSGAGPHALVFSDRRGVQTARARNHSCEVPPERRFRHFFASLGV